MKSEKFQRYTAENINPKYENENLSLLDASPLPKEMDYKDTNCVKILATKAANTAEGFYNLIKANCNTTDPNPSSDARLEMYLALAGLTCEIYMKSIIYFENRHGGEQCGGHNLSKLFDCMPDTHKETIKTKISDIEVVLPTIKGAFSELRYDYELNIIDGDYLLLFNLMEELKAISDSYPKIAVYKIGYAKEALALDGLGEVKI